MLPPLHAGFAEVDFTPEPGLTLMGQMHVRWGERVRDTLTANAAAFRQGDEAVVLISVDICFLSSEFVEAVQARFSERTGWPKERLLIHATHTHVAPTAMTLLAAEADPAFCERLQNALLEAAELALSRLEPVQVYSGTGQMEHMGWNRRAMFADGSSRMYGHSGMPGFIGMEGPRDPALNVLFTRNADGKITGVLVNFSTHPNAIEGASVYSADIPGEVRRVLRRFLGDEVGVVYLTGAAGNTAPSVLDPYTPEQKWRDEEGLQRSGLYLAGGAAQVIASAVSPCEDPVLRFGQATLSVPMRSWPQPGEPTYSQGWDEHAQAYYRLSEEEWPRRRAEGNLVPVRLNVIRIGDTAICTNPAELFVEFGLEIRQESPAKVTIISELTDGYVGYVPTLLAFERGGYETWTAPTSQLIPEAGPQIVAATRTLLGEAW